MAADSAARLTQYGELATGLALLSDHELGAVMEQATVLGTSIGGTTARLDWHGTPVFVKRVPLADRERQPENVRSTANLYGLPSYCQYGVGSPGFGAWRELAAHLMTTNWVLTDGCASFPLLYHWRVLERAPLEPTAEQRSELDLTVEYWHGSSAVRERLQERAASSADLVLFLEHFPATLANWLAEQAEPAEIEAAGAVVERELLAAVSFLTARGLLHFDAHFRNILTDGRQIYLSDFGLATSMRFALTEQERDFVRLNGQHDWCYAATQLVNWLVMTLAGARDWIARNELINRYARGEQPVVASTWATTTIMRYARVAAVMNEFYRKLHRESRTTPYPAIELEPVPLARLRTAATW